MKGKIILLFFILLVQLACAQKSCFDEANAYRQKDHEAEHISFDTIEAHISRARQIVLNCEIPDEPFITLDKKKHLMHQYRGKVLIIDFWSVHCPPCIREISSFHSLMQKYGKNLQVLAFTLDTEQELLEFLKKHAFKAEIIPDARAFVGIYALGAGYPFTLLVDKNGKIVYTKEGAKAEEPGEMDLFNEFSPLIDKALKAP
jgi:thiol-disulfide isomerase/thioredoxin